MLGLQRIDFAGFEGFKCIRQNTNLGPSMLSDEPLNRISRKGSVQLALQSGAVPLSKTCSMSVDHQVQGGADASRSAEGSRHPRSAWRR